MASRGHDCRAVSSVTGRELAIGAVYATLDRLEAKGLLTSSRVLVDGPSRRLFALTPAGARALTDTRAMRVRLWQGVDVQGLLDREWRGRRPTTSLELADLILEEVEVAVVPGEAFGPSGYLRLAYALGDEPLLEGVRRMQELFS